MTMWNVLFQGKGLRRTAVENAVSVVKSFLGDGVTTQLTDATPPESRADRFQAAMDKVSDAKSDLESLKEELESWKDNLPEGLQGSEKADQLDTAIDQLQEAVDAVEAVESCEVEFPGMY